MVFYKVEQSKEEWLESGTQNEATGNKESEICKGRLKGFVLLNHTLTTTAGIEGISGIANLQLDQQLLVHGDILCYHSSA